jgi:hypothetical protein
MRSAPDTITGELYFSDNEPVLIGHIRIGKVHYEIAGIRRSDVRTDITGHKMQREDNGEPCQEGP